MLKNIVILKPTDEVIYTEFFTAPIATKNLFLQSHFLQEFAHAKLLFLQLLKSPTTSSPFKSAQQFTITPGKKVIQVLIFGRQALLDQV